MTSLRSCRDTERILNSFENIMMFPNHGIVWRSLFLSSNSSCVLEILSFRRPENCFNPPSFALTSSSTTQRALLCTPLKFEQKDSKVLNEQCVWSAQQNNFLRNSPKFERFPLYFLCKFRRFWRNLPTIKGFPLYFLCVFCKVLEKFSKL